MIRGNGSSGGGRGWVHALRVLLLIGLGALTVRAAIHFPWARAGEALVATDRLLLGAALIVNLVSLVAKGWGWQRLLLPSTGVGWLPAQRANLVGSAVSDVSVSLVGEAARVRALAREGLPIGLTSISVATTRLAELVALGGVVTLASLFIPLPSILARAGLAAVAVLATSALLVVVLRRPRVAERLRRHIPADMVEGVRIVGRRPFAEAIGLALVNWVAQWATYWLVLSATHVTGSPIVALVALLAANLGGVLRLTPANVGVFQASLVVGLAPFGVDASTAVLAGLVLQAVQVPPILGLASGVVGFRGLVRLRRQSSEATDESVGDPAGPRTEPVRPEPRTVRSAVPVTDAVD